MKRKNSVGFTCVILVLLSAVLQGCITGDRGSAEAALPGDTGKSHSGHLVPRGIRFKVKKIQISAGDRKGVNLDDFISIQHLCGDKSPLVVAYGSPEQGGVLKNFGAKAASTRPVTYYPPSAPCLDRVPVDLRGKDGCHAEGSITVEVTGPVGKQEKTCILIMSPKNGQKMHSRTIRVTGKVCGVAHGTVLRIVVTPQDGREWVQDFTPTVNRDSTYSSMAYLGEGSLGVNEYFDIRVEGLQGLRSRTIRVKRVE